MKRWPRFAQALIALSVAFGLSVGFTPAQAVTSTAQDTPSARSIPPATSPLSSPAAAIQPAAKVGPAATGWTKLFSDSFDSGTTQWTLSAGSGAPDTQWGTVTTQADTAFNPSSPNSVWPAAAGTQAGTPASGNYPNGLDSWMIHGPIDLSSYKAAEIYYSQLYDIEDGDWLGFCVITSANAPTPASFADKDCEWQGGGSSDGWEDGYADLGLWAGATNVYIAFVFQSDASNAANHAGPFIDEVELWVNDQEVDPVDPDNDFVDWNVLQSESFSPANFSSAPWKLDATPSGAAWAVSSAKADTETNPLSTDSASPTASGSYSAGTKSWLIYGPVDLSGQVEASLDYSINYDLAFNDDASAANDDWLGVCATASPKTLADLTTNDFSFESCDWWTDSSGDYWDLSDYDLTPFAGQKQVYISFYFEANNSRAGGVFVDELAISGQSSSATIPDGPLFEDAGIETVDGGFDQPLASGLAASAWNKEALNGEVGDVTIANGMATITGSQVLYQTLNVPNNTVDVHVELKYALATSEVLAGQDQLCIGLTDAGDRSNVLVNVGCIDASNMPQFARDGTFFSPIGGNLDQAQVDLLRGKTVALAFHLTQNDSDATTAILDNIVFYTTGPGNRVPGGQATEVGTQRDANEPNDSADKATALTCNVPKSGVFGDVGGDQNNGDTDWFVLERVPAGKLAITVQARALNPPSSADAAFTLYKPETGGQLTMLGQFDDTGNSLDPTGGYDNPTASATFYIELTNYTDNRPEAFYTLKADCAQAVAPPAAPQPTTTPAQSAPAEQGSRKAWTVMLFLNGEDQACVKSSSPESCWDKTYEQSIRGIEAFIGSKQSFLNVVVLLDGPNYGGVASDVRRYVVQPDAAYTDGVNRWSLGELNMGDPQTLADFARWAMFNYPADHYYLAVDDHGGGTSGTSWDHNDAGGKQIDDSLSPAELRAALKAISNNGARKIDIFDFESCLMGMFENAYDLKDYTDYIAFFQSISWTSVNYPVYFRDLTAGDTVETVARRIIQRYPVSASQTPYTFGLVQTAKLEDVRLKLNDFAGQLMGADLATLTTIRNQTQAFNGKVNKGDAAQDQGGFLDLWDFANRVQAAGIAGDQADALKAAIDAAMVEKKAVVKGRDPVWDYSNYHGLSIAYPSGAFTSMRAYCRDYALSEHGSGGWVKFLTDKVFGGNYDFQCGNPSTAIEIQPPNPPLQRPTTFGQTILEPRPQAGSLVFLPLVQR